MTRQTSSTRKPDSAPVSSTPVPIVTIYRACEVRVSLAHCGVSFAEGGQEVPFLPGTIAEAEDAAKLLELAAAHLRGLQIKAS